MDTSLMVSDQNWLDVKCVAGSVPMPFQPDIFLLECHVAGTMYIDDILVKTGEVEVGTGLVLTRDPSNEHDAHTIGVFTKGGERIGWVPRKHNMIIARLMDAGKLIVAKVAHKKLEDCWLNLRISISLKD